MNRLDSLLYSYLVEDNNMDRNEFSVLSEEFKVETAKEIASSILSNISSKLSSFNLAPIDKSRGDIKNFMDLSTIQETVLKLTNLATSLENVNPLLPQYLKQIVQSITNLNNYAPEFKEAYRNKKTLMILRYQSVVLSVISALSYLVSVSVDFKDADTLKLKDKITIEEIAPIKAIIDFNNAVENGQLDYTIRDTNTLREFFTEYSVEQLSTIYEATDIISLINTGVQSFNTNFLNNGKRNTLILKVLGIVTTILSLRDVFYSFYNQRNKLTDAIQNLKTFLNVKNLPSVSALSRFITFNNKNAVDAVQASNTAKAEISRENKEIINKVKSSNVGFEASNDFIPSPVSQMAQAAAEKTDILADFNF